MAVYNYHSIYRYHSPLPSIPVICPSSQRSILCLTTRVMKFGVVTRNSACWLEAALRRESAKGRGAARRDSLEEEGSQALFVAPDPDMLDLASLLYMVERTTSFICS